MNNLQELVFRQSWEGKSYQEIAESAGYDPDYIKAVAFKLWQLLSKTLGEKITKSNAQSVLRRHSPQTLKASTQDAVTSTQHQDWGDAIDVSVFYGRAAELTTLAQWIKQDRCRLVAVLGMGGIGKTALSVKLAQQIQDQFDYLIWRSLRNAPPLSELLVELFHFLSSTQITNIPENISGKISRLMEYLRSSHGKITLHAANNSAWDPSEWLHDYDCSTEPKHSPIGHRLVGMTVGTMDINCLSRYVIDAETGRLDEKTIISDRNYTWATAIYADSSIVPLNRYKHIYWNCWGCWEDLMTDFIYDMYKSYKYRQIKPEEILQIAKEGKPANLCRLDTETMKIVDGYHFPVGYFGNSPQFVPRSSSCEDSTDGYIVCVVLYDLNDRVGNSEIWIFDAANLSQGPVCKISDRTNQVKLGLTIHTTWLPEIAKRTASYYIPVRKDYEALVEQQPLELREEIRELFEQEVYPHFNPTGLG